MCEIRIMKNIFLIRKLVTRVLSTFGVAITIVFSNPHVNAQVIDTELAGNSLSQYPFFEYIKAVNENATLQVAIDTNRFVDLVGRSCDIYVVNSKTPAQWSLDAALHDVTPDGHQAEIFNVGDIQENTFLIAMPFELSADAGIGLGIGYDVVLDCDHDGMLGDGDYIDGRSAESGVYAVHDTASLGPAEVINVQYNLSSDAAAAFGIPDTHRREDLFYPRDIRSMGKRPLVMIGHGYDHLSDEYGHIGNHLASYGYIVVSHSNDVYSDLASSAAVTTLGHTDAFIDQALSGAIADGDLIDKVDTNRIVWIGHSRGAEGVVVAYNRLFDGSYTPVHFGKNDIKLISSMLPTDFRRDGAIANPQDVNFHLWTAAGDTDVVGVRGDRAQTFRIHERATRFHQSTIVQGAGHLWFNNDDSLSSSPAINPWFSGPCSLGPRDDIVHSILLGHLLPLVKHYVEGNVPAIDFLTRQYESFRPIGVDGDNPCVVVTHEYRNGAVLGNFIIDDYETQPDSGMSSSGAAVSFNVRNLTEGSLDDNDDNFTWVDTDPFNGATQAQSPEVSKAVVFDWTHEDGFYEWEVPVSARNFNDYRSLYFRAAQVTQHPNTLAVSGDLTFDVVIRDNNGNSSAINIGAYSGGIEQPYARDGGWWNEMETVHIRITDFLHNASSVNLNNIVAVRLNVGPSHGSAVGRIIVDELLLSKDVASNSFEILEPLNAMPANAGTPTSGNRVLVRLADAKGQGFAPESLIITVDGVVLTPDQMPTAAMSVGGETWLVIDPGPKANGCYDLQVSLTAFEHVTDQELSSLCYLDAESRKFDRVLAIDQTNSMNRNGSSGSYSTEKMDAAIAAASFYVGLSSAIDKIGVVSFQRRDEDDNGIILEPEELAETEFPLTLVGEGLVDQRPVAREAISEITPDTTPGFIGPETSPGAALLEARSMLNAEEEPGREPNIILLTDGLENYAPFWANSGAPDSPLRPSFVADDIRIDTVGIGADADDATLQDMASTTGGDFVNLIEGRGDGSLFLLSSLANWYKSLDEEVRGEQRFYYKEGLPKASSEVVEFVVEPNLDWMTVAFHSSLDDAVKIELYGPGISSPIVASSSKVTKTISDKYTIYRIRKPLSGTWRYKVLTQNSKTEFFTVVSAPTKLMARLGPIQVEAIEKKNFSVPLRVWIADKKSIQNAEIEGYVRRPDGKVVEITLLDDGLSMDGAANDGLYGFEYKSAVSGSHFVHLTTHGTSSEGLPFKRYISKGVVIPIAQKDAFSR